MSPRPIFHLRLSLIFTMLILHSSPLLALFVDGQGHYALRGETRTAPGASGQRGLHQAIDQSFRLQGEARLNEKSSMFLEFRLFDDERSAYLGDAVSPEQCELGRDCSEAPQNTSQPGYQPYIPRVHRAFVRFASDYCIVEAGRRPRRWGMGLFLDPGDRPFATSHSVFDGISCDINRQKSQTLGISFGYDKLAETGRVLDTSDVESNISYGPSAKQDDVNQFYLAIELDDRRSNAGASLTKHVGIYAAKISSGSASKGGLETDLTFVDLYTAFYFGNLSFKSEVLFRLGKSADPSATRLGGAKVDGLGIAVNKMQSIGGTFGAEWTFAKSGSSIGPEELGRGNASYHQLFFDFTYAPGDSNGYFQGDRNGTPINSSVSPIHHSKRSAHAKAIAFHGNFSPTLIMFNGRKEIDDLAEDGIFDPNRIMNAQLVSFGYRYKDPSMGSLEIQLATSTLNETMPAEVEQYYNGQALKAVGFYGNDLGWELDLKYWRQFGRELDVGLGLGYLLPGEAWRTSADKETKSNLLVQSYLTFNF